MPAFSFEKITPPVASASNPPTAKKPRGVIVQLLDRFVESRSKRIPKSEPSTSVRAKPES